MITTVLSFDVGDLNLAYCVIEAQTGKLLFWNAFNCSDAANGKSVYAKCDAVSRHFEQMTGLLMAVDAVVIEQQNCKNVTAIKIGQHIWSWFRLTYPAVDVSFVSAKLKYGSADDIVGKSYSIRKKWAIEETERQLRSRNQTDKIAELYAYKKKDDLADAYVQALAYATKKKLTIG